MQCEELNTLFFYLKNKRYALTKILNFKSPLSVEQDEYELQIMYGLYFNSYNSLIEYIVRDLNNKQFRQEIISKVFNVNENNYNYTKELRNAIIHRGLDVSKCGIVVEGLDIIAPSSIKILKSKYGDEYQSFTDNLLQNIVICEKCNKLIKQFCEDKGYLTFIPTEKEEYLKLLQDYDFTLIPEYLKKMLQNFDFTRFIDIEREVFEKHVKEYFDTTDLLTQDLLVHLAIQGF